jgi:hypothetical protein
MCCTGQNPRPLGISQSVCGFLILECHINRCSYVFVTIISIRSLKLENKVLSF